MYFVPNGTFPSEIRRSKCKLFVIGERVTSRSERTFNAVLIRSDWKSIASGCRVRSQGPITHEVISDHTPLLCSSSLRSISGSALINSLIPRDELRLLPGGRSVLPLVFFVRYKTGPPYFFGRLSCHSWFHPLYVPLRISFYLNKYKLPSF